MLAWTTGRQRVEKQEEESEDEDREKTQALPQKLESIEQEANESFWAGLKNK